MKRSSWLLVLLVVGILMPRLSSAQVEAPLDTLSEEEAALEGAVLVPEPLLDPEEELAPPEDEAPLLVDEPTSPDEEVSEAVEEEIGDFQVQEADPDGMLPPDDPAADADIQEAGAEDEEVVVEAPEAVIPADDAPEDPEALLTGEDLEIEEIVPQTVDEGQPLTFGATATDVDGAVSLAIDGLPSGAGFADHQDGTATFTWTPGYDQAGTYTVTVTAGDGALSVGQSVVLTVVNVSRTVTAAAGDHGSITPAGAILVDYGSDQTFAIAAETGYRIDDVLVDGISVGAVESYTFSGVTTDHAISAGFLINTYHLTATAGIGGTVTPAGVTTVTYGSSQTYAVAPGAGYAIADVVVDGVSVGTVDSYTFGSVIADHAFSAGFVDIAPPVVTLAGAEPLLFELGTLYPESGATAVDQADGDLTEQIQVSGGVDSDAAGNTGSATHTVQVVVTPNSYGLIATHSMDLRSSARIHSGFAGVIERGQRPFLAGRTELAIGTRVQTAPQVRLSAPRVLVRDRATIDGRLVYTELASVGRRATIGQRRQVAAGYFPLFQGFGLPVFQSGTPGTRDVEVKQRGTATLAAGAYDEVRIKERGTLTISGGTYQIGDLEIGQQAKVIFLGPAVLLVKGQVSLGERSSFAPAAGVTAAEIRVYVEGRNGRLGLSRDDRDGNDEEDDTDGRGLRQSPRAVQVGQEASFQGNLYAPNATVDLRQGSTAVGSIIARDLILGVRTQVATLSGWNTPGVIYQPQSAAPLAKLAAEQAGAGATRPTGAGLQANYPNPFNPSTSIPYLFTEAGTVKLTIFNLLGQQVRVLVDQLQVPGAHRATWDGLDAAGAPVAGGVYLVRLQAGDHAEVRKMLLAK